MPLQARWFVRASLLYLLLGTLLGGALLVEKAFGVEELRGLWRLREAHADWLLVGWLLQLALGVASWILPRPRPEAVAHPWGWAAFALLNVGLLLRTLGFLLAPTSGAGPGPGPLVASGAGAGLEVAGVVTFAGAAWARIGYHPRLQQGKGKKL